MDLAPLNKYITPPRNFTYSPGNNKQYQKPMLNIHRALSPDIAFQGALGAEECIILEEILLAGIGGSASVNDFALPSSTRVSDNR